MQRVMEITGGEGAYAALDPVAGDFTSTVNYKSAIPQAVECMPPWKLGLGRLGTGPDGVLWRLRHPAWLWNAHRMACH